MSQAYLIIEDDPGRRLFLEKKLQGATAPWLLCDSSVAVNTLMASAADCVVIDVARLRVPFVPLWKELKTASGDHLHLVFTGTRGSEIATREETWDESVTTCEILNFASLRRRLGLGQEPPRERRRGIPRWKRNGLSVLETGIGAANKEIARADWIRYAAQYIHYEGEEAYFRALLQKLHRDLSWLKTVYPPEGVPASPAETLNPLGTGAGPFPARFSAQTWLECVSTRIRTAGVPSTLEEIERALQHSLAPWKDFRKWGKEGRAYRAVCSCRGIWAAGTAPDLSRPEAVFARLPRNAEHKRAARILKSLAKIGMPLEAGPGYLEGWTTLPREVVIAAVPQRDRPSVFFLRLGEDAGAYLWPGPLRQDIRKIPVDRPLAVEDIEISRLEKRGQKGEDEFYFEIPYPMKMRTSRDGRLIQLAVIDILSDEDMLRSSGMSSRSDVPDGAKVRFLAARTWAFEGGFMMVPINEEVEVEPQLRTYEKQMCSRYVYSEEAAERLRLLGVELFNRLLAARRMKRLRF